MAAEKGNKYALGNNGGRPPTYDNPEDLQNKCEEYFLSTDKYTITGLALYLGFCNISSLADYSNKKEFSYIIKRAKMVVENGYEEMFHNGSNAGIFPLKNMGWKDKTEVEQTVTSTTVINLGEGKKPNEATT